MPWPTVHLEACGNREKVTVDMADNFSTFLIENSHAFNLNKIKSQLAIKDKSLKNVKIFKKYWNFVPNLNIFKFQEKGQNI